MIASCVVAAAFVAVAASAALAVGPTGSLTETLNVGVRSLTVSPTSITLCADARLTFPNGQCPPVGGDDTVTVTNGPVGGHVFVSGADAVASDGSGASWRLCSLSDPCTGQNQTLAGHDEYQAFTLGPSAGTELVVGPVCDHAFDNTIGACGQSTPGQVVPELLAITGPSASNDPSPSFSSTISWIAGP